MRYKIMISFSVLIGAILVFAGDSLWERVKAVTCVNPNATDAAHAWTAGATVVVNVSGFPSAVQSCIKTAFDNWNNASTANGSNVTFNVGFDGPKPDLTTQKNVYQVTYQQPTNDLGSPANVAGNTQDRGANGTLANASTDINPKVTDCTAMTQTMAHEVGHTFGLGECPSTCPDQSSVMVGIPCAQADTTGNCVVPDWNNTTRGLSGPTSCDNATAQNTAGYPSGGAGTCIRQSCPSGYYWNLDQCSCQSNSQNPPPISPIVIDTEGEGFHLTSAADGVTFDIRGDGHPIAIAWTDPHYHNAFLALDRNGDGKIDNGKELFGNFTQQPESDHPNGFLALAEFDKPENGGNGDGVIDEHDAVFSKLRLWIDDNHDGISQPGELHALSELGIHSLSLSYYESRRKDAFGNQFRYRALVNPGGRRDFRDIREHGETHEVGRWAYDVFLVTESK